MCPSSVGRTVCIFLFADTLYPMGLATAAGSLLSVLVCLTAYAVLRRGERRREARLPE